MDVSVIVPVYNGEKNIKNLFKCFQKQNIKNAEFIIINDGSTDKTDLILKKLLNNSKDNRFIYRALDTNQGVSNARNIGISMAQGNYLMFVDSDDLFTENFISTYLQKVRNNKTDIEFFSFYKNNSQQKYVDYSKFDNGNTFDSRELLKMFFAQKLRTFLFSFISKASLWNKNSFSNKISYQEDTLALVHIILSHNVKARFNSSSCYFYNFNNSSNTSNNLSVKQYWQAVEVDKKIEKLMTNKNKLKDLVSNMYSKELSELMGVIAVSLHNGDMVNYNNARQQYIGTYRLSSNITFKQKIKRKIQYILLLNDNVGLLKMVYSKII